MIHNKFKHHRHISWLYSHCSCQYTHRHTHTFSCGINKVEKTPFSNLIDTHTNHQDATPGWMQLHPTEQTVAFLQEKEDTQLRGGIKTNKKKNLKRPLRMTNDLSSSLVSLAFFFSVWNHDGRFCFCIWTSVALNAMRLIADPNHVLQGYVHDSVWTPHTSVK